MSDTHDAACAPLVRRRDFMDSVYWLRQVVLDMQCECADEHLATLDQLCKEAGRVRT